MLERSNQNLDDSQHLNPVCGLNIAAEIVKVMGGTIKIDSRVGEGTDFNVSSYGLIMCILLLSGCNRSWLFWI